MFILASASPRRLKLLAQIGIVPDSVISANINETPRKGEPPITYATRMASEKALAVAAQFPDAKILAADTVVACGQRILGKAEDDRMARRYLELLSGRRHCVHTAVCVCYGGMSPPPIKSRTVTTRVQFKRLHHDEITAYLSSGEWQGTAGGYAIQGRAAAFIPWISGSYANVVGLPLAEVARLLE